jgi:hypothetical protein
LLVPDLYGPVGVTRMGRGTWCLVPQNCKAKGRDRLCRSCGARKATAQHAIKRDDLSQEQRAQVAEMIRTTRKYYRTIAKAWMISVPVVARIAKQFGVARRSGA